MLSYGMQPFPNKKGVFIKPSLFQTKRSYGINTLMAKKRLPALDIKYNGVSWDSGNREEASSTQVKN